MKRIAEWLTWLFSVFYAYVLGHTVWWVYDPANKDRDGTGVAALLIFFILPFALLVVTILYRDMRNARRTIAAPGEQGHFALWLRVVLSSLSLTLLLWLLILAFAAAPSVART